MTEAIELIMRCPRCGYKFISYHKPNDAIRLEFRVFTPFPCDKCKPQTKLEMFIS